MNTIYGSDGEDGRNMTTFSVGTTGEKKNIAGVATTKGRTRKV